MFGKFVMCAALLFSLSSCGDGGSDGAGAPSPSQTSASISGTVFGSRIVAVDTNDQIIAQDDTAGRPPNGQGQLPWSLSNLPVGTNLRLFFVTGGRVYPLYFGTPSTNVFG